MKAMILAAGYGSRMGALTRETPKPLLKIGEHALIEHLIRQLASAGIRDIVVNVSYLADVLKSALGNGAQYGVNILYSEEHEPLEWGGGVLQALPHFKQAPFLVVSGDLWTDYPFEQLTSLKKLAHLVLIPHTEHHLDFSLNASGIVTQEPECTYGGIGVFHPDLFSRHVHGKLSFCDVVMPAIHSAQVTGERYEGIWVNVGTPACLEALRESYVS